MDDSAFEEASRFFADVVAQVPEDGWPMPGLGQWSVLELVGHGSRALTTVVDYVERPQQPEPPGSDYFTDAAIASRGRDAVAALGDDPVAAVAAAAERAIELVRKSPPETMAGSPGGTVTLAEYLPSRTAELIIHGLDLARALGRELAAPSSAVEESLVFAARRASRKSGQEVLLALAGRGALPERYSVY